MLFVLLFAIADLPLGLLQAVFPSLLGAQLGQGYCLPVLGALIMLAVLGLAFNMVPALACRAVAGALKLWLPHWPGAVLCALLSMALTSWRFVAMGFSSSLQ